jgi:hypothetical protein
VSGHKRQYPRPQLAAWRPAAAQIKHQPRIARYMTAKWGWAHARVAQKPFNVPKNIHVFSPDVANHPAIGLFLSLE